MSIVIEEHPIESCFVPGDDNAPDSMSKITQQPYRLAPVVIGFRFSCPNCGTYGDVKHSDVLTSGIKGECKCGLIWALAPGAFRSSSPSYVTVSIHEDRIIRKNPAKRHPTKSCSEDDPHTGTPQHHSSMPQVFRANGLWYGIIAIAILVLAIDILTHL